MLHNIDENGTLYWHCHSPRCSYHNCQGWDEGIVCQAHPNKDVVGQTHAIHLSDEGVKWLNEREIELPACPQCKRKVTLSVHSDEEVTPPVIARDEQTGRILQVSAAPGHEEHGNLWFVRADTMTTEEPHPTLAHLSPGQIQQMQDDIRSKAPQAPVEWMLTRTTQQVIHEVYPHPAVERHRELARQLRAAGKVPLLQET